MIQEKVFTPKLAPDHQIILDATSDLIVAFDKEYQIAYCNKAFKKNFQMFLNEPLDENRPLNENVGLVRFIDLEKKWIAWLDRAFNGEQFRESLEYKIIAKKLYYNLEFTPVIKNNEVAYIQISAREETLKNNYKDLIQKSIYEEKTEIKENRSESNNDIILKERDDAIELLLESAQRLQMVYEGSSDGFWDWDIKKDEIFYSKQYFSILGYRNGEIKSDIKSWQSMIHEDDLNSVIEALFSHLEGKTERYYCEYRIKTKHGKWKWVLDRGKVAIRDEQNNPLRIAGTLSDIDKRIDAEKRLRLTQYTVDKSAVAIFWYDKTAKFFYTNENACNQLGYSKEEMFNLSIKDIDLNWTEEKWQKERIEEFEENTISKKESILRKKTGEEFPVEIITTQMMYENEIVFVAFVSDITKRKKAEIELRESEERFVNMADNLPVMVWLTDKNLDTKYINKKAIEFIGKDSLGGSIEPLIHEDDLEFFQDVLKEVVRNKEVLTCELRLRQFDKNYKWILCNVVPRVNEKGYCAGLLGVGQDITERKEIETRLLESETQFNEITSVIGDGVFMSDANGKLQFANPEFSNLLGYTFNEVEGENIHDIIHNHDSSEDDICPLKKVLNTGETLRVSEDYFLDKYGAVIPVSYVITPIKRNNEIIGSVSVFHNISERLENEEEMRRYVEELQFNKQLMEENAVELARLTEMLGASETQLKELNASKDKFFSIISHDLRSPFTSIIGFAEVILEDLDILEKEDIKEFTSSIYKSSKNIQNLLENLLQWSRVQTGRMEFNPISFNLGHLANDIVALYQVNAARKKISLFNGIETQYDINADKFMIDTVIRNLVSNSIKFTRQGGEIKIDILELVEDGLLQISVSDNGVGMNDEVKKKLFKIDEHVTTKGTEKEKGTGIGLILCKEFIEKHQGKIWVESTLGKGSVFKFTIPHKF